MKNDLKQILKQNETNKEFINFINENKINEKTFNDNYDLFQDYLISYNLCKKRENLSKCQQKIPGYRLKLAFNTSQKITTILTDCLHRINNLGQKEIINNFLIRHYDDSLLSLSWSKNFIVAGKERQEIVNYLKETLKQKNYRGLYLYGDPGVGKTFIFILLANKLIQKKHTVCFISWPEFIMEIKKSFKNGANDMDKKIEQIKICDYLFIDDLGAESISSWERDEILFSILNARTLPLKTTFINSSYNLNDLMQCYRLQLNKIEEIKIKRLFERIKKLTNPIKLTKQNLTPEKEKLTF